MRKVVVIGGGFAGANIAKNLQKDFDVTLIDTKDYFEFTPAILRAIVEPKSLDRIRRKHRDYLPHVKFVKGNVNSVAENYVLVEGKKIYFDYLAICSGSRYSSPIKEQNLIYASRSDNLRGAYELLKKAKSILIIGGGPVGVELAGEICTYYSDKDITLVHSWDRLVPRNRERTSKYIQKFLEKRGVEIILNDSIDSSKKNGFHVTRNGRKVKCDLCFLTKGAIPNFEFLKKNFSKLLNKENQVEVDDFLRVNGESRIFAAGDINSVKEEKTAQNAKNQAKIVVKNIRALEDGRDLYKYSTMKNKGMVLSLGKRNGVFERGDFVLTGFIPSIMKWVIERIVMNQYK